MRQKALKALGSVLTVVIWITIIAGSLVVVVTVLSIVSDQFVQRTNLAIPLGFSLTGTVGSLSIGGGRSFEVPFATGYFSIENTPRGVLIIVGVFIAFAIALAAVVMRVLRRIVVTAAQGEPFERGNARRVRLLGALVIGYGVLRVLYQVTTYLYTRTRIESEVVEAALRFDLAIPTILAGLLLLALGEIFRHGEALQSDADLTV